MSPPDTFSKAYEAQGIESKWREIWSREALFTPAAQSAQTHDSETQTPRSTFFVAMPPPNITGSLHMGHALCNTLKDIVVRFRRMSGDDVLWLPGTDHAGIATQMMVERALKGEGTTRRDLGREAFLARVWAWKETFGSRIEEQVKVLGASCDWSRNRFTMSEPLSRAVREAFVRLFNEGLIERAERLINWCPQCQTALSDLEVDHEERSGSLWHLRYPIQGRPGEYVVVATTRPETMLGDSAVAVHSADPRYTALHGALLDLPLTGRSIPVICDDILVDAAFGSGAVKVTPAHDFNDFLVGKRHQLPSHSILDSRARIALPGSEFDGLERAKARTAVIKALEALELIEKIEPHKLSIGHCQRCKSVVEPRLSPQWYVRIQSLAEPALAQVQSGATTLVPEHWRKTYEHWMSNIQDWCISRQLWWGHQIPVFYCLTCNGPEITLSPDGDPLITMRAKPCAIQTQAPTHCPSCAGSEIVQDPDVLDTWFSSGLWPFSTLGWPDEAAADLQRFYPLPGNGCEAWMETGSDILFFWVARMMMMGLKFMGHAPFQTIYLHSMVRDENGEKMSKTKGNVIDPLDLIHGVAPDALSRLPKSLQQHFKEGLPPMGADALRMTLAMNTSAGQDIKFNIQELLSGRAFVNKLWNAARFAWMHLENYSPHTPPQKEQHLYNRWILCRLNQVTASVHEALQLKSLNIGGAIQGLYHFVWNDVCDWYFELTKPLLKSPEHPAHQETQRTLVKVLDLTLRLLHPFIPFVTEEIWQALPRAPSPEKYLATAAMPRPAPITTEEREAAERIELLKSAITALRMIRGEYQISPSKQLEATLQAEESLLAILKPSGEEIKRLAMLHTLHWATPDQPKAADAAVATFKGGEALLSLTGLIDFAAEAERLTKEIIKTEAERAKVAAKFENPAFAARAPKEILAKSQSDLAELDAKLTSLNQNLRRVTQP